MNGAIFGASGRFSKGELELMDRRLCHRGSDGHMITVAPGLVLGWRGGGARSNSQQEPLPLVCACRLLNRAELLERVGMPAGAEVTDAALLWRLYRACGSKGFSSVNGQFALALYDEESDSLILAVDSWGSRPLSFANCSQGHAFATEYKALLALETVRGHPDASAMAHLQATKYLPKHQGLLSDVRHVTPGSWVRLHADGWTTRTYDAISLEPDLELSGDSYARELRVALLASCDRLVDGLDSVGVSLSGGLDSTLTVGAVRTVAPKLPIYTYTTAFSRADPTLARARETARYFGTTHREVIIPLDSLPKLISRLVWNAEDPVAREEMIVYLMLAETAAMDVPLLLHGHLSDMLFAGMPRHLLVYLATHVPLFEKAAMELYDYSQTSSPPQTMLGSLLVRTYYRGVRCLPPRVIGGLPTAAPQTFVAARSQPVNSLLLDSLTHPTEIGCIERLHAHARIGYGSIYHDLQLAKCAFRIPERLKIRLLSRKYILRKASQGILPARFIARPKDVTRVPRADALQVALMPMARALLNESSVLKRGVFDVEDIGRLVNSGTVSQSAYDHFYHLWTVLLTEVWLRTFIDGRGASPLKLSLLIEEGRSEPQVPSAFPIRAPVGLAARTAGGIAQATKTSVGAV